MSQPRQPHEVLLQAEREQAHREATMALERRWAEAAAQPGLAGELRRAYRSAKLWPEEVVQDCGIDRAELLAFLAGDGELTSSECDRLAARLGLHLTPVSAG